MATIYFAKNEESPNWPYVRIDGDGNEVTVSYQMMDEIGGYRGRTFTPFIILINTACDVLLEHIYSDDSAEIHSFRKVP